MWHLMTQAIVTIIGFGTWSFGVVCGTMCGPDQVSFLHGHHHHSLGTWPSGALCGPIWCTGSIIMAFKSLGEMKNSILGQSLEKVVNFVIMINRQSAEAGFGRKNNNSETK